MSKASSIHAVGSRQSFNDIPDSDELISLETLRADEALPEAVTVDREATSCQIKPSRRLSRVHLVSGWEVWRRSAATRPRGQGRSGGSSTKSPTPRRSRLLQGGR